MVDTADEPFWPPDREPSLLISSTVASGSTDASRLRKFKYFSNHTGREGINRNAELYRRTLTLRRITEHSDSMVTSHLIIGGPSSHNKLAWVCVLEQIPDA